MPRVRTVERSFNLTKHFDKSHSIHTVMFKEHFRKEFVHIVETLKMEYDLTQGADSDVYCYHDTYDMWVRICFDVDIAPET